MACWLKTTATLEVVYTAEKGTLKPVTEGQVTGHRVAGIASIIGAILVLLVRYGVRRVAEPPFP